MSKRQRKQRPKTSLKEQWRRRRIRSQRANLDGVDPAIRESLEKTLGGIPTRGALQELEQAAVQQVLKRLVELELAKWMNNSLLVLRDEFGFDQDQLTHYARTFRKAMDEQAPEPAQ